MEKETLQLEAKLCYLDDSTGRNNTIRKGMMVDCMNVTSYLSLGRVEVWQNTQLRTSYKGTFTHGDKITQKLGKTSKISRTPLQKKLRMGSLITFVAKWLSIHFFECSLVQLLTTVGTAEMFRMKLLSHGGDTSAINRLLASGAQATALLVIVHFAQWHITVLIK